MKRILRAFLALTGALVWVGLLISCGYLWLGGFFYAKNAPIVEALLCAGDPPFYRPLGTGEVYLASSCMRAIYQYRGSADDVAMVNSDQRNLYTVLYFPDITEADKMLTFWISRGANINIKSQLTGATLIELAAKSNDADLVELLLKHGARTDIRNNVGQTPLEALRTFNERRCKSTEPNAQMVKILSGNQ